MVPTMKAKNKKIPFVQIDYLIHIQEIKPWPPSQSLRTLRSVLIQWDHGGDRNSGVTAQVVPSLGSGVCDGRIEFNESFKISGKNGEKNSSQKKCIEFSLIEPRRDKTVKGQVLGTAIIDLADYGVLKESLCISVAINCKRSYRNTAQSFLLLKIDSIDRIRAKKNGNDSVSVLMSEEYAEEAEIASFTDDDNDDDVNSNSSPPPPRTTTSSSPVETNGGSSAQNTTTVKSENVESGSKGSEKISVALTRDYSKSELALSTASSNGCSSSRNSSTDLSSWFANSDTIIAPNDQESDEIQKDLSPDVNNTEKFDSADSFYSSINGGTSSNDLVNGRFHKRQENEEDSEILKESDQCTAAAAAEETKISYSEHDTWMNVPLRGALISHNGDDHNNKHVHVRSVRSSLKSSRSGQSMNYDDIKETRNVFSDSKMEHLEQILKKLEWELTEAAAMEAALYSIVADHGSSANKVHAPARRLSRFYIHTAKDNSQSARRRTSAAKSCVSGLILVAKACGNDVPRLTFWLSNTIILRTIISESFGEEEPEPEIGKKKTFPLKWQCLSSESFDDWEDSWTLENALEKVEEWIVTRIIESLWWQTLTPHMQSFAPKTIKMSSDQEQVIFSLELWKKAFMDAYARICPVRAEGHECGCLPALSPMIMDQCVARLDVAMLNAILCESGDDHIPTNPVSNSVSGPICDSQVLPIPAGKASFGAGAQLKNAIGNWTRWLDDLLGHETNINRKTLKSFHHLNELSELMMLPKDMLLSRTIRKEVCPTFGPTLIRRVLNIFVQDEFCPDPIPKIVLEALNSDDSFDDEENAVINYPYPAARIEYIPPLTSDTVRMLRDGSLLVTISHSSDDDELDMLDSPLSCIHTDITTNHNTGRKKYVLKSEENANHDSMRYQLLRKIWNLSS